MQLRLLEQQLRGKSVCCSSGPGCSPSPPTVLQQVRLLGSPEQGWQWSISGCAVQPGFAQAVPWVVGQSVE